MTIDDQIAAKITAATPAFMDGDRELSMSEGITKLSGLPSDFVPALTANMAIKNGILDLTINSKIANAMFDLVMASLAIGYAEGRRQAEEDADLKATDAAKTASDTL